MSVSSVGRVHARGAGGTRPDGVGDGLQEIDAAKIVEACKPAPVWSLVARKRGELERSAPLAWAGP